MSGDFSEKVSQSLVLVPSTGRVISPPPDFRHSAGTTGKAQMFAA
jgi:hypothetical protein